MTSRCNWCGQPAGPDRFGLCDACDDDLYDEPDYREQVERELKFVMELQQRKDAA